MIRWLRGAWWQIRVHGVAYAWARLRWRLFGSPAREDYATWIALYDTLRPGERRRQMRARLPGAPRFSLLLALTGHPAEVLASLAAQTYGNWEMCKGLEQASGDFVIPLAPGDRLAPTALYRLACAADSQTDLIYTDEDRIIDGVRCDPRFKPDYSPELLFDPAAIGGLVAWRRGCELFRAEAGELAVYDMVLRVAARARRVVHIPAVLLHRGATPSVPVGLWQRVLDAQLGEAARAVMAGGRVRVMRRLPAPLPLVSVIIPTRDRAALLARCVDGLLEKTEYPELEILIVDNDSRAPDALALLDRLARHERVRILRAPGVFNYAAMNNAAAEQARGAVLALLNNDVAVIEPGWLREMVAQASVAEVGAVGAKLLYPDGTIQHAGVVTGLFGVAGHVHRGCPADAPLLRVQAVGAVSGACMVLRRSVFRAAGGFDATFLPVSYNDVDLCLRLRARGLRIVFTPHAVLEHAESVSRGDDRDLGRVARARAEADVMRKRWGRILACDMYYNPNLSIFSDHCLLAFPPRRVGSPRE